MSYKPFAYRSRPGRLFAGTTTQWEMEAAYLEYHVGGTDQYPMPCPGTFSRLSSVVDAAPGAGQTCSFTLIVNGVASTLTHTIDGAADTEGSNLVDSVHVAAGDLVYMVTVNSAGSASSDMAFCLLFEPDTEGLLPFLSGVSTTAGTTWYHAIAGGMSSGVATEYQTQSVVPVPGKFRYFYMRASAALGGGETEDMTLRVNGIDSALTLHLGAGQQLATDLVTEVVVAAGDMVSFGDTAVGGWHYLQSGICFIPDDPEVWFICRPYGFSRPSSFGTEYSPPTLGQLHTVDNWFTPELGPPSTLIPFPKGVSVTGMAIGLTAAPGGGTSWTFTARYNQADTGIAVAISGADTFGVIDGLLIEPDDLDGFSVRADPVGAPAAAYTAISLFGGSWKTTVTAVTPSSGERGTP